MAAADDASAAAATQLQHRHIAHGCHESERLRLRRVRSDAIERLVGQHVAGFECVREQQRSVRVVSVDAAAGSDDGGDQSAERSSGADVADAAGHDGDRTEGHQRGRGRCRAAIATGHFGLFEVIDTHTHIPPVDI